ncbi:hypothetical protein WJX81_005134 [Elliptochloris bilobata]|uniref:Glycine cleavage system H protein n=1 Tax=Elliptochloris bilobata TaxID=381761 RepID=A0AAW1RDK7_9CHLO
MALRKLASQFACTTGLRVGISPALQACRESIWRSFATVSEDRKYAASHEWAKVDGDIATIGISDFAQAELGDIVYVEMPEVGSQMESGAVFGVVESVKAASDVYSPVSGEVVEFNEKLVEEPGSVNKDPFGEGWMVKLRLSDPSQVDSLMDAKAYEQKCASDDH